MSGPYSHCLPGLSWVMAEERGRSGLITSVFPRTVRVVEDGWGKLTRYPKADRASGSGGMEAEKIAYFFSRDKFRGHSLTQNLEKCFFFPKNWKKKNKCFLFFPRNSL